MLDDRLLPDSLYQLTQKVAAATRPEDIYEAALLCLRDSLGVEKASILLFDDDGVMRFKAWVDLSSEYRQAVEGHSPWQVGSIGPKPVLVADVAAEPSLSPLRNVIEAEGIRALAFVPLSIGGRLLGKFMLYYPQPHDFSVQEILFAGAVASHVAFAIDQQGHRDQQAHLDAMFSSAVTGIAETDAAGHFRVVNDRYCEIVGRTRQELLSGIAILDITHPDDRERNHELLQTLVDGAGSFTIEKRYIRPDGSLVWVSNSVSAIRDEAGQLRGAIAVVSDITERKQTEAVLRQSEQRYQDLVGALGLAVYTTDAQGRITLYNEAAAELWGRRPELLKELWCGSWRMYDPDGGPVPLEECPMAVALKEDRAVRDVELMVEKPDGSRAAILPYPTPLHDASGAVIGAINVLVDITERKKAEEEALYKSAIVESSEDAIISKDLNGIITSWNRGAEKIFGYTADEIVGRSIRVLIPADRQHEEEEVLAHVRRGEVIQNFETVRVRKDGSSVPISVTISPVQDRDGRVIGASKIAHDITDRKLAEETVRQSIALKDQFLGLVSHELRTPIATIYGNGLLLLRRGDQLQPEDKTQALTDIVSEAGKLQAIIENLLLITRLEAGRLEPEPLAIAPLVDEAIAEFHRTSPDRQVALQADADVPPAIGQQTLVSLVLRNLLGNAGKYSPPDTTIEVRLRCNEAGWPEISVRDHGIGMDKADIENLFVPFFRTQRARLYAKGMGLGLAVCNRIVEAHGGALTVQSSLNEGSEFVFSLPPTESDPADAV